MEQALDPLVNKRVASTIHHRATLSSAGRDYLVWLTTALVPDQALFATQFGIAKHLKVLCESPDIRVFDLR